VPHSEPIIDEEYLQNTARPRITSKVLANIENDCKECISREKHGYGISSRQDGLRFIPADAVDGDAYKIEIQIDTECNAACAICSKQFSSLWRKQLGINEIKYQPSINYYKNINKYINLDKLTRINFLGGEPFVNDYHLELLKQIPYPENVIVQYCSNGSIAPSAEMLSVWEKFKLIHISFSIDDMGDRFTYIRWPLKWDKVDSAIKEYINLPKVRVSIHATINPLNMFYIKELENWAKNLQFQMIMSACKGVMDASITPATLREELANYYPPDHKIISILNSSTESSFKMQDFISHLDKLDVDRNLDWKKTFKEVATHFV
jgi:hypothetical protein